MHSESPSGGNNQYPILRFVQQHPETPLVTTSFPSVPLSDHPSRWRSAYALAVGSVLVTLWLRVRMDTTLGGHPTLIMFTIPIMLSAYAGGIGPGLLATLISCLTVNYFLIPPIHSFAVASPVVIWDETFLVIAGLVISALNEGLHRARRRAREGEELFARTFRLSPDCVAISRLSDRVLVEANDRLCALAGGRREDVIGRTTVDFIQWTDEAERTDFLRHLIDDGECLGREARLRVRDDRELYFSISSRLITFGDEPCVLSVMRDITGQKLAAVATARLAAIVDSSADAIIGKDLATMVTSWNEGAERLFGYRADEMIGQSILRLIPPERQAEEATILDSIRQNRMVRHFETVRQCKDGTLVDVSVTVSPIRDASGRIVGASKVARNITARRRAEQQIQQLNADLEKRVLARTAELEAANRELEAFSYSVSHDLRAPLRAVDGFSQAVLEDFGPQLPAAGLRQLKVIRESAQRMGNLIDDLLAFSRLSRQQLEKQPVDMTRLVRSVLEDFATECGERRIEISVGDLPACEGDPHLLRQVLINLVSNALKYSRKRAHARITIGCQTAERPPVYYVRDNGSGFDMRYAGKLFGVFQRLHRAEDYEGTGVGLAIVQRIIHRHGGRIWADSAVDSGATFFFTLEGASNP